MLLNDFFEIKNINYSEEKIEAKIKINPEHEIFKGHFPGNPVVPGVVSIQIINEILSNRTEKKLFLAEAKNIKFPAVINPEIYPELFTEINFTENEKDTCKVNARIFFNDKVFLKLSGVFKKYIV